MPHWRNTHRDHQNAVYVSADDAISAYQPGLPPEDRRTLLEDWKRVYGHVDFYLVPEYQGSNGHAYLFYRYGNDHHHIYCLGGTLGAPYRRRGIIRLLNKHRIAFAMEDDA